MELTLRIADTGSDDRCHWLEVEALDATGNVHDRDRFEFARATKMVLLNPLPDPTNIPPGYKPRLRGPVEANVFDYRILGDIASRHFLRRQAAQGNIRGAAFGQKTRAKRKGQAWQPSQISVRKGAGRDAAPALADRHIAMRGAELLIDAPDLTGKLRRVNIASGTVLTQSVAYDERYSLFNTNCMGAGEGSGYVGRGAGNDTNRFWMKFSLTSLPAQSYISTVDFKVNVSALYSGSGSDVVDIIPYNTTGQDNVQTDACATRYANSIVGTPYVDESTAFTSTGVKTFTLPPKACADIEAAKAAVDRFSMALNEGAGAAGNGLTTLEALENAGTDEPKLVITYATDPLAWTFEADMNRDGTYDRTLTTEVDKTTGPVTIDRGMDESGIYKISQVSFGLENRDGDYTPEYSSSPVFGQVRPGVPFRITSAYGGSSYTWWTGYLKRPRVSFESGRPNVAYFTAEDLAAYLRDYTPVNVVGSTARDSDGALTAIATAMGLVAGDLSFDDGVQDFPLHFAGGQAALDAMMDAVRSELGGHLWITAGGLIRFEAQNSRVGISADDTWGDGTQVKPYREEYEVVDDELISTVSVQPTLYQAGVNGRVVWSSSQVAAHSTSLAILGNGVYTERVHYDTPVTALTTPVANTDYQGNDAADGSGTDRTSSLTMTATDLGYGADIKIVNALGTTVYVTKRQLRGTPQDLKYDRPIFTYTLAIPGQKADAGVNIPVPFASNTQTVRDYAYSLLRTYRYEYPRLKLGFHWAYKNNYTVANNARMLAMHNMEIGDLIKYDNTDLGATASYVNDWFYVESYRHTIDADGSVDSEVWLIPSYLYRNLAQITYDTFDRANVVGDLGTNTAGDAWTNDTGFDINSSKARPNAVAIQLPVVNATVGPNLVTGVSLSNLSGDTDEECGLIYRYTDTSNYWRCYVDDGTDEIILEKVVAGVVTELSSPAWTPADTAEIQVIPQGNRHRVYLDRKLVIDVEDAALNTATGVGMFSRSTTAVFFAGHYAQAL